MTRGRVGDAYALRSSDLRVSILFLAFGFYRFRRRVGQVQNDRMARGNLDVSIQGDLFPRIHPGHLELILVVLPGSSGGVVKIRLVPVDVVP